MKRKRSQQRWQQSNKKEVIQPLSNFDIQDLVIKMKIPYFNGVFMRDTLMKNKKKTKPKSKECWILNHGSSQTDGTHWTALAKNYDIAFYFDSFGKLPPPLKVIEYLNGTRLFYNSKKYQKYGTNICGHLCLRFLYDFWQHEKKENNHIKSSCIR